MHVYLYIYTGWWFGTFFHILGIIIIPTDFHIFQRGRSTTNPYIFINSLIFFMKYQHSPMDGIHIKKKLLMWWDSQVWYSVAIHQNTFQYVAMWLSHRKKNLAISPCDFPMVSMTSPSPRRQWWLRSLVKKMDAHRKTIRKPIGNGNCLVMWMGC
jgi:hypothetical protein